MNWFYTNQLDYTYIVDLNPYFPNIIFVSGTEDGPLGPFHFYRSFDEGATWQDSLGSLIILESQFHPDSSNIAYAYRATKIFKTTNTGKTWSTILGPGNGGLRIEALRLHPEDPDILYAGGDGRLYKTTNGGEDWFLKDSALIILQSDFQISSIWIDESTSGRLYVGFRNFGNAVTGLFLTEDDGKSWKQIYDEPIFIIEADNENPRNIYCIANDNYKKIAIRLLDTFTVTGVNDLKNLLPERFYLFQNYPNPFNPATVIKYRINEDSFVQLKVYDILGRLVKTLVSIMQAAGEYSIEFNAEDLSAGVYFYTFSANDFYQTKKMILLP